MICSCFLIYVKSKRTFGKGKKTRAKKVQSSNGGGSLAEWSFGARYNVGLRVTKKN